MLLTTHYMEEAEALCDRVGIINGGRLLALDTVENLRAQHGFEFKITYQRDEGDGEVETLYGNNDAALVEQARTLGIHQYSLARTNLENVYLALTGNEGGLDDTHD